jgi:hypothetical protein
MMGYVDLNQNKRTDWVTPPDCRELLAQMGPLKLDVCTAADNPMGAQQIYTPETDGLKQSWICGGLAWANFPWSRTDSPKWVEKACAEGDRLVNRKRIATSVDNPLPNYGDSEIILLGPSRSDTLWFRRLWHSANAMYLWRGRMTFINPDSGLPCMGFNKKTKKWEKQPVPVPLQLSYWGPRTQLFIDVFSQQGGVHHRNPLLF